MKSLRRTCVVAALALLPAFALAQAIDASRGVDPTVDYEGLKRFGPWSEQNLKLTAADLSLLADNEAELNVAIPAFFRVALRRQYPDLPREGRLQYPHSALPLFLVKHRGYLVNGKYYRGAERAADGRWRVRLERPVAEVAENGEIVALEGEARVTNPNGASESSIEVSPIDPDILVAGSNGPGSGQRMHYSFDGGATWTQSAPLPLGGTCCDPTIGWSSDGRFTYTATLSGGPNYFYRSADNGQTWDDLANEDGDPRREISAGGFVDKEFLHVDRSPNSPFQDNIYLTWHESNIMRFSRSTDFGNTWDPVTSFSSNSASRGIGSDIATTRSGE
ncbi:MAG: sialidase family protein, partial [Pseudomonadota bacterium]